jgi:hypothetical protein
MEAAAAAAGDLQIEDLMQHAAPKVASIDIVAIIRGSLMPDLVNICLVVVGNIKADLCWLLGVSGGFLVGVIFFLSGLIGCVYREFVEERGSCGFENVDKVWWVVFISTFTGVVFFFFVANFLSSSKKTSKHVGLQTTLEDSMIAMNITNSTDLLRWHACRVQWQYLLLESWESFRHQIAWLGLLLFAGQASLTWLMFKKTKSDNFITGSWLWGCVHTALLGFLLLKLMGGFTHSLEITMPILNRPLKSALVRMNWGSDIPLRIRSCTRSTPCDYCRPHAEELKNDPVATNSEAPPLPADQEELKAMLLEERSKNSALEQAMAAKDAELSDLKTELGQHTTTTESIVAIIRAATETASTETAASEHKAALQWTLQHWDSKDMRPCFRVLGPIEVTSKSIARLTRVFTAFGAYIAANIVLAVGVSLTANHVAILEILKHVPYIGPVLKYAFPSLSGVM